MTRDDGELAAARLLVHHDDRQAVRGPGDLDLLAGGLGGVVILEHQDLVRVLVVGHEELLAALALERQQAQEVVVVTELVGLRLGGLLVRVELGGAAQDRVAPADDDVLRVAVRNGHLVGGVGRDGREAQTARAVGLLAALAVAVVATDQGSGGGGGVAGARDDRGSRGGGDGHDGGAAHDRPAGERTRYDVADVLVVTGVGRLVETGVTAAVTAGHGGTSAGVRVEQRQQFAHFPLRWAWLGAPCADIVSGYVRRRRYARRHPVRRLEDERGMNVRRPGLRGGHTATTFQVPGRPCRRGRRVAANLTYPPWPGMQSSGRGMPPDPLFQVRIYAAPNSSERPRPWAFGACCARCLVASVRSVTSRRPRRYRPRPNVRISQRPRRQSPRRRLRPRRRPRCPHRPRSRHPPPPRK